MPSQVLFIYTILVTLVYLATDRFNHDAPFAFTIPVVVLGVLTLGTSMAKRKRTLTAFSFFTLAAALYHWSVYPNLLELSSLMIGVSHVIYFFSFVRSLRKIWKELAVITLLLTASFLYIIFADLFRSLPILVISVCLTISVLSLSFIVSGSVWKHGSAIAYEEKTAFFRLAGMFLLMICDSALFVNHFASHMNNAVTYLNFTYYISQFLLFFANERAF